MTLFVTGVGVVAESQWTVEIGGEVIGVDAAETAGRGVTAVKITIPATIAAGAAVPVTFRAGVRGSQPWRNTRRRALSGTPGARGS